ncbi:hypothetical protein LRP52_21980, partial [Photobacterium sp. ZSDE20]|nr:hypothetical protein [Photobacterium sp. ZSDE20]
MTNYDVAVQLANLGMEAYILMLRQAYVKVALAQGVISLMNNGVTPIAMHSSMRNVDVQFVVSDNEYQQAIRALYCEFFEGRSKTVFDSKVA